MILVTGATGQLGRAIVQNLLNRIAADQIGVSVRDPAKAADLAAKSVTIHKADFADRASLEHAFAGADQVLIVSANTTGEEALRLHRAAIDAAQAAGVRRLLYTSHMGARAGSPFAPADQHAGTERTLAQSGVSFTALRHGFYAESCLFMIGDGLRRGELRTPEDGPISWTARGDLAEADAAILTGTAPWQGRTPPLTASEAITMAQLAALATEATGREVKHTTISDEAWRNEKVAAGMPEMYAEMLLGTFRAARRGDFAATNPTLAELLGRAPTSMRDILAS